VTQREQDCKKVGFSKTVKGALQAATLPTSLVGSGLNASSSLCLPRHRSLRVATSAHRTCRRNLDSTPSGHLWPLYPSMGWDSQQRSLLWLLVVAGGGWRVLAMVVLIASKDEVTNFGVTNFVMMSHIEVSASQADSSASIP
jgi:hypothetical protein